MFLFLILSVLTFTCAAKEEEQGWRSRTWSRVLDAQNKIFGVGSSYDEARQTHKRGDTEAEPKASCGSYTRENVVDCFDKIADLNCDKKLSAEEIDKGRKTHLSYIERFVTFMMTSTEIIMNACDKNKDGFIDHEEFLNRYSGCLNNERELCHVKDICARELQGPHVCGR